MPRQSVRPFQRPKRGKPREKENRRQVYKKRTMPAAVPKDVVVGGVEVVGVEAAGDNH